ncbi:hypothetical protein Tco_1531469 [Tanacetum coccineum]
MDDPNITMEEYIRLEEEKARKRGKVFNWETAKYAIVFNDNLSSNETLSCEPTVSSLNNNEIDFRILFDKSDDEDYTVVFDKILFSYKIISTNDLKMDLENDNEKVNMPSFPSPEPKVSYIDDLDFFKDFENEFPAIVYNDALTSKSDFSTEPTLCPQHIDKFDFKDETSFSEYDEEEQNGILVSKNGYGVLDMAPLPPHDQRHLWLYYQVEGYIEEIVHDFEQGLETIFGRHVNRVHILDFEGLTLDMRQDLAERLRIVYTKDDGQEEFILEFFSTYKIGSKMGLDVADTLCFQLGGARRSMTWRQCILALEDGFRAYWLGSERVIPYKRDLSDYWVEISSGRDFLRGDPSYTYIRDPFRSLCHRHTKGKKSGARLFGGHFIRRLAHHFGLVSDDGLRGLSVVTREIPLINMASGPERQPDAVGGAPRAVEDAPAVDEGALADPAPVQAPQPPPPPPTTGRRPRCKEIDEVVIMEYFVKIDSKVRILELKRRYFEDLGFDTILRNSIKEDMAYMCLHSPKIRRNKSYTPYLEKMIFIVEKKEEEVENAINSIEYNVYFYGTL